MIFLIILCGLCAALIITNLFIYAVNRLFHCFNYQMTHSFYYLLSSSIVLIAGLLIGLFIIGTVS